MRILILNILLFLSNVAFCKNAAFIFTSEKEWGENSLTNLYNSYASMEISVNGIRLLKHDKTYKIRINDNQLDTLIIKGAYGSADIDTILAKLNSGTTYKITFNVCSFFQIIPSKELKEIKLVRLIAANRGRNKLFLNSGTCFIDPTQLWNRDTTDYFMNATLGMCPYAPASFEMCSKDIEEIKSEADAKDCQRINLYFSGGEMFTLYFDYVTNKISAKFDGYNHEKLNIKIGEINRD